MGLCGAEGSEVRGQGLVFSLEFREFKVQSRNGKLEFGIGKREFGIGDSESGIGRGTRPACPQSGMNCECCQCESVANPNSQLPISDSTPMAHKGASLPLRLGFAAVSRMGFDALRATTKTAG